MKEKIIVSRHDLVCDLCGHRIPAGDKCRMIMDDFAPQMTFFEHLQCPTATAVLRPAPPVRPAINHRQQVLA